MTDCIEFPNSRCLVGVARGDITPPVGMYHRMWGAATHDRSTGVHRPLLATALVMAPEESRDVTAECVAFVAVDHCLLGSRELDAIVTPVASATGLTREQIVVCFSHTHAAGLLGRERVSLPGGELIPEYFAALSAELARCVGAAIASAQPASVVYGRGHCDLATNRDYFDARSKQYVCGFNPDGAADPTVLVARISARSDGRTLATLVNYACHPTTLAWENTLISPDYVGAMRETVEGATIAPCIFVQGASGDIGPREGFVGATVVADRNGRQLGYAALAALEALPPAGQRYAYAGPVVSGATLGTWRYADVDDVRRRAIGRWQAHVSTVALAYRSGRLDKQQLGRDRERWQAQESAARAAGDELAARDARAMIERTTRRLARLEDLPAGDTFPYPIRLWRMGDGVWVALDGEHYNVLQRRLRERFPDAAIVVATLANGSNVWYLPDRESYGKGLYQEEASLLARGSLETLIETLFAEIENLLQAS